MGFADLKPKTTNNSFLSDCHGEEMGDEEDGVPKSPFSIAIWFAFIEKLASRNGGMLNIKSGSTSKRIREEDGAQ